MVRLRGKKPQLQAIGRKTQLPEKQQSEED
jgi:hypothetical protein